MEQKLAVVSLKTNDPRDGAHIATIHPYSHPRRLASCPSKCFSRVAASYKNPWLVQITPATMNP
jgi:hypothetical protein